jgi:hypothetical protein
MKSVSIEAWRKVPKEGWNACIVRWCRRYNHMTKHSVSRGPSGLSFMTPTEKAQTLKRRKHRVQGYIPMVTTEVPSRLPYRFSDDKKTVEVDEDFIKMVKLLPSYPKV